MNPETLERVVNHRTELLIALESAEVKGLDIGPTRPALMSMIKEAGPEVEPLTDREIEELERMAVGGGRLGTIAKAWLELERRQVPDDKFVYVAERQGGIVKVGMSNDPERRVSQLNKGMPESVSLVRSFDVKNGRDVEAKAHDLLDSISNDRWGEWFDVDAETAVSTIKDIVDE